MPPRLPNLHIRTRIAIWIATISIGLLVLMAAAVYVTFDRQLKASLDDTLTLRSDANRQLVDYSTTPPTLAMTSDPQRERFRGEAALRLYGSDGSLLSDASPATGMTGEERIAVLAAVAKGGDLYRTIDLGSDEDYRVIASPLPLPGGGMVVLVTGLERSRITSPLRILRWILIVAVPLTAACAGFAAFWIAHRALMPVAAMTATARRITSGDLHQRVPGAERADELGRLAGTLNAMIERLGETVERERRFTADASHELRTPLAAIETGIDVTLAHERPAEEYRRVLEVVRGQARRLNGLANQLLLLSRLDADQMREHFAPVELGGLLEAVVDSFQTSHPAISVRLEAQAGPSEVIGDLQLLARAVMNLLENAAVHAGSQASVAVALARGDGVARIAVEDDGPGIPPALRSEIFQRFRRGDSARGRGGAGLGLAIVEAIVTCHGGTIGVAPTSGQSGARFEIALPLADT